jgi:PAS domain S-box-containing protein
MCSLTLPNLRQKFLTVVGNSYYRFAFVMVFVLTGYALLFLYFSRGYTDQTYEHRKDALKSLVEIGLNAIEPIREQQQRGELSYEQALELGTDLIRRMTYTTEFGDNYLFMSSYTGQMLVQPFEPQKEGTDQWDLVDINGKYIIRELVATAINQTGEGYVDYYYPPPGSDIPQRKVAYVVGIPEWNSYLGTGMYMGDLDAENRTHLQKSLLLTAILVALIVGLMVLSLKPILSTQKTLLRLFDQIRRSPDDLPEIPNTWSGVGPEGKELLTGFHEMLTRIAQNKRELLESQERFDLVMRGTNDGIWDWDLRTNQVYYSPRWKSMLGYDEEEIEHTFDAWRKLVHPEDLDRAFETIQQHLDGESSSYALEHRLQHKDGTYRWILARGLSLQDAAGKPYRMAGSHTDMTERKLAEKTLEESEAHLRSLMENAEDFAVYRLAVDADNSYLGKVILVSPSIKDVLGISDPYDFDSWFSCIHPDDLPRIIEANRRSLETGESFRENFRLHHVPTQQWVWIHGASTPVLDSDGKVAYFNGLLLDITEQKKAETELQQAYQTMEQHVEERTKELATLNAISSVVNRSLDLNVILNDALDKILEITEMDFGVAYQLSGDPEETGKVSTLLAIAQRGLSEALSHYVSSLPLQGTVLEKAWIHGNLPMVWKVAQYPNPELKQALDDEAVVQGISIPILVKGRLVGAIVLATRQERTHAPEELTLLAGVAQQVGVAFENARLYKSEQERHLEAERRREVAEGLREILEVLNSKQSLDETLEFIVTQACRLLGSDAASLLRLETEKGPFVIQSACGLDPEYIATLRLPLRIGHSGQALVERTPKFMSNVREFYETHMNPTRVEASLHPAAQKGVELLLSRGFMALLAVPLVVGNKDYGAVNLYYRQPHQFSPEELRLAMSAADQAALAIESANLREQAKQSAITSERSRLARDLHDAVTQSLYSLTLYAEAAARLIAVGKNEEAVQHLRDVRDTAQEALREMRLLIFQLRPLALEKGGIATAIQNRLEAVELRAGIQAELQIEGSEYLGRLSFAIEEETFHIVQEALNNVLRHAKASQVHVHIQLFEDRVSVEVSDNGAGFELDLAAKGRGLGLISIRERAQRLGGELDIESVLGQGTRIYLEIPLDESEFMKVASK